MNESVNDRENVCVVVAVIEKDGSTVSETERVVVLLKL